MNAPARVREVPEKPVETTDHELLRAHVEGDPDAFGELVRRHQDRMWAIALRTTRDPEDAADALQDAYTAAFRRAASFRGDAEVTTWLHRVVVNACLDRLRHNERRRSVTLPEEADRAPAMAADEGPDPILAVERRNQVARALDQLNPDQRAALVLVDMEGYSVEEASVMLGCAPGTVKSRCFRGRAKLAPLLIYLQHPDRNPADRGSPGQRPGNSTANSAGSEGVW